MTRKFSNPIYLSEEAEAIIKSSEFLGEGNNGVVYLLPDKKRIIKIFNEAKVCKQECQTLLKSKDSIFFPKVYSYGEYYIVRDFVDGKRLDKYLKTHSVNETMVRNILAMLDDFKKLGYKRIDIRCKDIFVNKNLSLMIIDPKNQYSKTVTYPRHLLKGIYKKNALNDFFYYLEKINPLLYYDWRKRISIYLFSKKDKLE